MPTISCSLTQGGGRSDIPNNQGENTADPMNPSGGANFYMFRPNMSGIPAGSTINSASLRIYAEVTFNGGVLTVYEMLRAWTTTSSWNNYDGTGPLAWTTAGASGSGDRSASSIGSYTLTSSEDAQQINSGNGIALTASVVQGWLDGTNNGCGLFSDSNVFADFSGVADGTNPPVLFVDYTEPVTGYTLTADSGTYSLTGQSANTLYARIMAAGQGTYALTGVDALLVRAGSYQFAADPGSYTLVGSNALVDIAMNAEAGTYALTGQDATLTYTVLSNRTLTADAGTYALTGQNAGMLYGRILTAEMGLYALTGRQAGLIWSGAPASTGYATQRMTFSTLTISL